MFNKIFIALVCFFFTCSSISGHWEMFLQNRLLELFPPIAASMFVKFKRNL